MKMTQDQTRPKETDLSKVRYIISDWDGTLVDSMGNYASAFSKLMSEEFGVANETSEEYYHSTAGRALTDQIREAALNYAGQKVKETTELEQKFWNSQVGLHPPQVMDGARETLQKLQDKGLKVIVWSGTKTEVLMQVIKDVGFGQFVTFAIGNVPGSTEMVKGKWAFGEISKALDVPEDELREHSIVIGDGKGDMEAGKEVGCKTITIPKNPEAVENLKSAGADFVIDSIAKLPQLLRI